jgi:FkbM family methyltransferase
MMPSSKRLLKTLLLRICSPGLQHKLRREYVARRVLKSRGPAEPEMEILESLISAGDLVADIGANVGVYTREFSLLVGQSGRVYSCEPVLENYLILEYVTRKAKLSNVQLFNAAIGSKVGQRQMVIPDLEGFTGYYQAHFSRGGEPGESETVQVLTIEELWKSKTFTHLDFIKCDVEGAELVVVEGAMSLIEAQLPAWLMEVSRNTSTQIFTTLKTLGYRAFVYHDGLNETENYRDREFSNYFFLHPKSKIWQRAMPHARLVRSTEIGAT